MAKKPTKKEQLEAIAKADAEKKPKGDESNDSQEPFGENPLTAGPSIEEIQQVTPVSSNEQVSLLIQQNADLQAKLKATDERFLQLQQQHKSGDVVDPQTVEQLIARIQQLETGIAKNQTAQSIVSNPQRKASPEEVAVRRDPQVLCVVQNLESPHCEININMGGVQFDIKEGDEVLLPLCVMDTLMSIRRPNIFYDEDAPAGQQIIRQGWIYRFAVSVVSSDQLVDARRIQKENNPELVLEESDKPMKAAAPVEIPGEAKPLGV